MSFFDFLKKKKNLASTEIEIKRFTIEEIEILLDKKRQEAKSKERDLVNKINSLIARFSSELKDKNEKLKKVDLSKKQETQKIKDLVLENLKIYSEFIDALIISLNEVKEENLQQLINDINKKITSFERNSNFSFSRANFLIGKEITTTKESIKSFFNQLNEIVQGDKSFLENLNKINLIEKQITELKKEQEACEIIKKEIKELNVRKLEIERQQEILKAQTLEIENSEAYLTKKLNKENAEKNKKEIENELLKIKTSINWKKLAEIFHSISKKMEIIKSYEQDFSKILTQEGDLIEILKDTNLETENLSSQISQIRQKKEEIEKLLAQKDELEGSRFTFASNEIEIKSLAEKEAKISNKFYEIEETILNLKEKINEEFASLKN